MRSTRPSSGPSLQHYVFEERSFDGHVIHGPVNRRHYAPRTIWLPFSIVVSGIVTENAGLDGVDALAEIAGLPDWKHDRVRPYAGI